MCVKTFEKIPRANPAIHALEKRSRLISILALMTLVASALSPALGQNAQAAPDLALKASSAFATSTPTPAALSPGDLAPGLFIAQWLRGRPMPSFTPDSVSVVVFWASWCDASVAAISTLNAVQRRFAEQQVRLIAISSRDSEGESVARMKARLDSSAIPIEFSVAFDERRRTAHAWLDAAEQEYIPTAFIVDRTGKVAWIGSPLWPAGEFQEAVAATVAGELDARGLERLRDRWSNFVSRVQTLEGEAQQAQMTGQLDAAARIFDQLITLNVRNAPMYTINKFSMLLTRGREEQAYEFARAAIVGPLHNDASMLNELAWSILDEEGLEKRDFKLALAAARRAEELTQGQDPAILDTIARAYQCLGDLNQAIAFQTRAVELAPEDSERTQYAEKLVEYRKARGLENR